MSYTNLDRYITYAFRDYIWSTGSFDINTRAADCLQSSWAVIQISVPNWKASSPRPSLVNEGHET